MKADDALQAAIEHANLASQLADIDPAAASAHAQVSQAWTAISAEHVFHDLHTDPPDRPDWVTDPAVVTPLHRPEGSS